MGPGQGPGRGEPVFRRGENTPRTFSKSNFLKSVSVAMFCGGSAPVQVLIELESALLDDQPHWYKLQLHDVSSLPLPNASPYLQRRGLQADPSQRRLQSETH